MFRSLFHLACAFAAVSAAYYLYALFAVPMIEGDGVRKKALTDASHQQQPSAPADNSYLIDGIIPEDSWEHQGCKIVETRQGLVLFKNYVFQPDGRVEVEPFTMIAMDNSESINSRSKTQDRDVPPVILRSPQGAILVFDGGQGAGGFGFGNLIGGQLPGDVEITRKPTSELADDGFHLQAHNVQIDGPRIITPHDVVFRLGHSHGSGRDLTIELATEIEAEEPEDHGGAEITKRAADLSKIEGIESLELATLNELVIQTREGFNPTGGVPDKELPGNELGEAKQHANDRNRLQFSTDKSPDSPAGGTAADNAWTRVSVKCAGAFHFDFTASVASFYQDVHIERLNPEAANETLDCQRLDVVFDKSFFPDEEPQIPQQSRYASNSESSQPQIQKIVATGTPAVLRTGTQQATARAHSIEFEIATQKVTLRDPIAVTLRDPQHEIVAPQLEYTLGDEGRIGVGWAPGPGRIEKFATDQDEGFAATWGVEMNIRPHDGKTAISLYERAHIQMGEQRHFDAGELHLWLWEIPVVDSAGAVQKNRWRLLPAQMLATDDVSFQTEQVVGTTQQAQGFWPKPLPGPKPKTVAAQGAVNEESLTNGAQPQTQSGDAAGPLPAKPSKQPKNLWRVSTGQAHFHLDRANKLQMLELVDSVEIREQSVPYTHDNLVIQGSSLIVTPAATADLFNINVIGNPAVIAGRSQTMYGNVITLDQQQNRIVVPGEGKMRIEDFGGDLSQGLQVGINREQQASAPNSRPQFVNPNQAPKEKSISVISWKESLQFDGREIKLTGEANVQTRRGNDDGELNVINASADQIRATLDRRIDLQNPKANPSDTKPQVAMLNLAGKVDIKNHTYLDPQQLKSIDRVYSDDLVVDTKTGDLMAGSAGMVETVRIGEIGQEQPFAGEMLAGTPGKLNYLQVKFAAGFSGNLYRKEMTFHRKVRSIYGPVSNWAEKLDIEQQQSNPNAALMDCDQLTVGQWQADADSKATIEMEARGNVSIRSSTFRTNSESVAFYQESDMLMIQGASGKPAQLWYVTAPNTSEQYAEANEIKYWRKKGQILVDRLEKAEYSTQEPLRSPTAPSGSDGFAAPRIRGR